MADALPPVAEQSAPVSVTSEITAATPASETTQSQIETPSQPAPSSELGASAPSSSETIPPVDAERKPSLLAEAGEKKLKPVEVKAEVKPDAAKAEVAPTEVVPEPISYQPFNLPTEVKFEEQALGKYTEVLGKHRATQELGQELVDMYVSEVKQTTERLQKHQWDVWSRTQEDWTNQAQTDPDFGGSRMATTLRRAGSVIEQYGGSPEQIADLRSALTATGAGNHPALVRLFNNLGKALGEGRPVVAPTPKVAPDAKPSRAQRRYTAGDK